MLSLDITNLALTIINLIVLYLILRHFLFQPVLGIMEKRNALIEGQLSNASETKRQADDLRTQYEERLTDSRAEAERIVEKAKHDAGLQCDRMIEEADGQARKILEGARREAVADQERALKEARAEIAGLVMAAAAKVIGDQSSQSIDQSIYNQFIAGIGDGDDADRS